MSNDDDSGQFYIMCPASQNKDLKGHEGERGGRGEGGGEKQIKRKPFSTFGTLILY